jgi:hypothetical protein
MMTVALSLDHQAICRTKVKNNLKHTPDFGVAHEPIRKTDSETMRCQLSLRVILSDSVHICCVTGLNSIAFQTLFGCDSPAIMHTGENSFVKVEVKNENCSRLA